MLLGDIIKDNSRGGDHQPKEVNGAEDQKSIRMVDFPYDKQVDEHSPADYFNKWC